MEAVLDPSTLWRQLKSIDVGILDHLAYLSNLTAKRSRSGAHYATPGRRWLAAKLGVSIRTITRHTTHLAAVGILTKRERRRDLGRWQTNLYCLVGRGAWMIARRAQSLRRPLNRGTELAHKPPSEREDSRSAEGRAALRAIIQTLTRKLGGS